MYLAVIPAKAQGCPGKIWLQARRVQAMRCIVVLRGLVPRIHVFIRAPKGVDAHGSSPWAEGPRVKPGQDGVVMSRYARFWSQEIFPGQPCAKREPRGGRVSGCPGPPLSRGRRYRTVITHFVSGRKPRDFLIPTWAPRPGSPLATRGFAQWRRRPVHCARRIAWRTR